MKYHFVEICINSYDIKRLLKFNELEYREIKISNNEATFLINKKYLARLTEKCEKYNIEIKNVSEIGNINKIKKIKYIKIFGISLASFLLIVVILSMFIWNITIDGNVMHTSNELYNFIRKQNVYVGEYKGKIDCDEIEKKIRNKYSDITWVCAEIKGTNLIIHVNENYNRTIKEQENSPYNIIANCDAQIDSIITRAGVGNVKKGDKVKKGDLLISGEVDTYNEFEEIIAKKYVKADGEIYAKVKYEFNKKYKIKEKVKKYGKKYSYFNVSFGDMAILNGEGKNKDIVIEKNKLHFLKNYYLPVTFTKITNIPFKYVEVKRNKTQIKTLIDNDFTYYLMTLEQKGYKILEKNVKMEIAGDKYIGKGQVTVVQPFGSLEELSISEEGTTVNERD